MTALFKTPKMPTPQLLTHIPTMLLLWNRDQSVIAHSLETIIDTQHLIAARRLAIVGDWKSHVRLLLLEHELADSEALFISAQSP